MLLEGFLTGINGPAIRETPLQRCVARTGGGRGRGGSEGAGYIRRKEEGGGSEGAGYIRRKDEESRGG